MHRPDNDTNNKDHLESICLDYVRNVLTNPYFASGWQYILRFLENKRVQECIKEDSSIFALVLLYNVNIDSMVNETNDTDLQKEIDAISQSMNTVWEHVVTDKDRVQRLF